MPTPSANWLAALRGRARQLLGNNERRNPFARLLERITNSGATLAEVLLVSAAVVVGVGTGVLGALLIWALQFMEHVAAWFDQLVGDPFGLLLGLLLAGALTGTIASRWAPEAVGHGVPEVIKAVALRSGRMAGRIAPFKLLLSAITIGMGGSAGREGPIVQIGAAYASSVGRLLGFSGDRLRILVACGAAAGIAAVFNTPIAGALFALEVILRRFTIGNFGAVVIGAVSGSITARILVSEQPAFPVPAYRFAHLGELPIYIVLGIAAAIWAAFFIRLFSRSEQLFAHWRMPLPVKAATGMLLTGLLALLLPGRQILGSGLEFIGEAITDNFSLPFATLGALLLLKAIATSVTLGAGNSGGVFAPNLFMGAVLGGSIGQFANGLWPTVATDPGAYALVGMAAVLAAAERAPITAILLVFELSGDYQLILPLMLSTVLASLGAQLLAGESIYTSELGLEGIRLQRGRDVDVLGSVAVGEVMTTRFDPIAPETTLEALSRILRLSHHHGLPVIDSHNRLIGVVTISDLERALAERLPGETPVSAIATPYDRLLIGFRDESIGTALQRMSQFGIGRIPIVDRADKYRFLGMVRREDMINAYTVALTRRNEIQQRAAEAGERQPDSAAFVEATILGESAACNKTIKELAHCLPYDCVLVAVRRHGRLLIPHGDTRLLAGDLIVALVADKERAALGRCLGTELTEGAATA